MSSKRKNAAAAAKPAAEWPRVVAFGSGRVHVTKRANGFFSLAWRELGEPRRTTKTTADKALEFAAAKARFLDGAAGKRWVSPAEADLLAAWTRLAGPDEGSAGRLLADATAALRALGGGATLAEAARYYAEQGPMRVERTLVAEAIARFLAEYRSAPDATRRTYTTELDAFARKFPRLAMLELTQEVLEGWTGRKTAEGQAPAARTRRGRITTWITFLNRARDWNLLGPGKHAAALLRRPVIPDAGREILSVAQGAALLAAVREDEPKLEAYLVIAGWLGLRPSECQRLTWEAFDFELGYCHVSVATAKKTSTERYVPMDAGVSARLRKLRERSGKPAGAKVCGFRSREFLSVLARKAGVLEVWPPDVLRHSFCSYRLAVLGAIDRVAEEAGNSAAIIRSNYRRPVRPEEGAAWWEILNSKFEIQNAKLSDEEEEPGGER